MNLVEISGMRRILSTVNFKTQGKRRACHLVEECGVVPKGSRCRVFGYTYAAIADLCGMRQKSVRIAANQGRFDPMSLSDTLRFILEHRSQGD